MLRQRLVRQSAVSVSSESTAMPSPPPLRRRRDAKLYRQMSSDSLDHLLTSPADLPPRPPTARRHSVACGVLYVEKPPSATLKSAFNSAVRRMSDACSMLSSAPSSTYNLSCPSLHPPKSGKKESGEVILPHVLTTFRPDHQPPQTGPVEFKRNHFQVNRRFSTDCPPPSYTEATVGRLPPRQKWLTRQQPLDPNNISLVALQDDDDHSL